MHTGHSAIPQTKKDSILNEMVFELIFLPSHMSKLMQLCSKGYKRKVAGDPI